MLSTQNGKKSGDWDVGELTNFQIIKYKHEHDAV